MSDNMNAVAESGGEAPDAASFDIRHMSLQQLAQLGVSRLAYVKPVLMNGEIGFAIHAADGTPMAVAAERETALAAIRQHDMQAVLLH